jgi:transposase
MISQNSGDRFVRSFDPTFEPNGAIGIRRLEVITGVGGRRSWSRDDKARIIAESFAARANVSAVARRYGLRPQQVYAWRRLAREGRLALPAEEEVGFVPVITTGGERPSAAPSSRAGVVEIEIAGAVIRVCAGVDTRLLCEVVRAVKAAL